MTYNHCYESDREGRQDSNLIGVIHNGNEIGKQFEEEILRLSNYQNQVYF